MNIDLGKLLLRLGFGGAMIPHGYSKLERLLEHGTDAQFADPFGIGMFPTLLLAILSEVICPILVILGIKTRFAAIPVIITMVIAAFVAHADDPWAKKEMAFLYLIAYTVIALIGAGRYAINRD